MKGKVPSDHKPQFSHLYTRAENEPLVVENAEPVPGIQLGAQNVKDAAITLMYELSKLGFSAAEGGANQGCTEGWQQNKTKCLSPRPGSPRPGITVPHSLALGQRRRSWQSKN